ncbi:MULTISPECIES: hypothetical protein [Rhizobium]|uniref:hypothetical protein n=1 Tax=Rhizobium TaxID=379 RepID=UPI000FF5A7D9|nr:MULTISPECIES: hypothetical protein [Rhizobium]RKE85715.1 hypothetical protein DFO46_2516 [Rhizobium sp. AG855]
MSKPRDKGIIAYGTAEDREKLAALADLYGISGSEVIVKMIRDRHLELFEKRTGT